MKKISIKQKMLFVTVTIIFSLFLSACRNLPDRDQSVSDNESTADLISAESTETQESGDQITDSITEPADFPSAAPAAVLTAEEETVMPTETAITMIEVHPQKTFLSIRTPSAGVVYQNGDIAKQDRIRLYCREYRSADESITDKLLIDAIASLDQEVTLTYDLSSEPLSETRFLPDFSYRGNDIEITALYVIVSDDYSEIRSDLAYIEGYLDTGVVDQHPLSLSGSTACGAAAGTVAMQINYPSSGDDLFARMNTVRNYAVLGEQFSTGPSGYYMGGDQISNSINKYNLHEVPYCCKPSARRKAVGT